MSKADGMIPTMVTRKRKRGFGFRYSSTLLIVEGENKGWSFRVRKREEGLNVSN